MNRLQELFDLHVHSVRSDGVHSVLQLAELARRTGLAGFALTDHDTPPDETLLDYIRDRFQIRLIPGVEMSCTFADRGVHVLMLGAEAAEPGFASLCRSLQQSRRTRWRAMLSALNDQGVRLDYDRLERLAEGFTPCRSHLGRELVRAKQAKTVSLAFQRFLRPMGDAVAFPRPTLGEAVAVVHAAGGVAVLAHPPYWLTDDQWPMLAECGLDGIECRYPAITQATSRALEAKAAAWNLVATAGSDYHGDIAHRELGSHTVDRLTLDTLLARRQARSSSRLRASSP